MTPLLPASADRLLNRLFEREDKFLAEFRADNPLAAELFEASEDPEYLPPVLVRLNAMIIRAVDWKYAP